MSKMLTTEVKRMCTQNWFVLYYIMRHNENNRIIIDFFFSLARNKKHVQRTCVSAHNTWNTIHHYINMKHQFVQKKYSQLMCLKREIEREKMRAPGIAVDVLCNVRHCIVEMNVVGILADVLFYTPTHSALCSLARTRRRM